MKRNPFYAPASSPATLDVRVKGKITYDKVKLREAQQAAKEHGWNYANYLLTGAISFENDAEFFMQFWDEGENFGC